MSFSRSVDFRPSVKEIQTVYVGAATSETTCRKKHEEVIPLNPHVAKSVKIYFQTLKWEVQLHPPYSKDIAPSDYYFLRSMAHDLAKQQLHSQNDIEEWFDYLIASQGAQF